MVNSAFMTFGFFIFLPWMVGYLLIQKTGVFNFGQGARVRALGVGFFVGFALLTLVMRWVAEFRNGIEPWYVLGVMSVIGLLLVLRGLREAPSRGARDIPAFVGKAPIFLGLLALLVALHVSFSLLEIITRPVFPWDGWTVWVYRAKAWFLNEAIFPFYSPGRWAVSAHLDVYTTPALNYPWFVSLMYLWAASGLGEWHEALVNLPVFVCAAAIALTLFGSVRSSGGNVLAAVLAIYLLMSTPLFGVHMSLGGYADIWLAGFSGLGMMTLMAGHLSGQRREIALGLLLLVLGCAVKIEGFIWLLTGISVLMLARIPIRVLAMGLLACVFIIGVAWVSGITSLRIPGLGLVGYEWGMLAVPFKGFVRLEVHDVADAYLQNAFMLGNWHLLWVMALVALAGLLRRPGEPLARIVLSFLTVFLAVQAMIFVFTTEGAWAEDYTAINRMPLQMLPAMVWVIVVTAVHRVPALNNSDTGVSAEKFSPNRFLGGASAGLLIALAAVYAWQLSEHKDDSPMDPLPLGPGHLNFVIGAGAEEEDRIVVNGWQDGLALLSSGPLLIDASDLYLLQLDIEIDQFSNDPNLRPAFFWRRADQPAQVSRITLGEKTLYDLSISDEWQGQISEVGFFVPENTGTSVQFDNARLEGRSLQSSFRLVPGEWTEFEPWTQRSTHWVAGGAPEVVMPMTLIVGWVILLMTLGAWITTGRRQPALILTLFLVLGWVTLDLRWGWDRWRQAELTWTQLRTQSVEERISVSELGRFYPYLQQLMAEELGSTPKRIVLIRAAKEHKYFGLRSKYQLLPHSVAILNQVPSQDRLGRIDYVLFLGDFTREGGGGSVMEKRRSWWKRKGVRRNLRKALELVSEDEQGTLLKVRHDRLPAWRVQRGPEN